MQDGMSLYAYVACNPIASVDPTGMWKGGDHKDLTQAALNIAFPMSQHSACYDHVLAGILAGNAAQDQGTNYNELWRHYNRPKDSSNANVPDYNGKYLQYLFDEEQRFWNALKVNDDGAAPNEEDCAAALYSLGLLTHSWQDYYAHAVLMSGSAGPAWPSKGGSPDSLNSPPLKPSGWGGDLDWDEHGAREPAYRDASGTVARKRDAIQFVATAVGTPLFVWEARCRCFCKQGKQASAGPTSPIPR